MLQAGEHLKQGRTHARTRTHLPETLLDRPFHENSYRNIQVIHDGILQYRKVRLAEDIKWIPPRASL